MFVGKSALKTPPGNPWQDPPKLKNTTKIPDKFLQRGWAKVVVARDHDKG